MITSQASPSHENGNLQRSEVAKIVKNFIEAVEQVVATTAQTRVTARTKAATLAEYSSIEGDAAGALAFIGDFGGQFIIVFTKEAICEITTNMLYASTPYKNHRDPDVEGAIGELTNQIGGQARKGINERTGWKATNGIPSVIVGESIRWTIYGSGAIIVRVPFTTPELHEFYLEVAVSHHPAAGGMVI
ncbi:MAG: chemotaxis protein CheX [Nitrospinae bacterium]|nr:chemotaxis protein CheX [Nitrospinota bacterium]